MKQPPHLDGPPVGDRWSETPATEKPAQWRRPAGVAPGTWDYVHMWSIADRYDAFVDQTGLCRLDAEILDEVFPSISGRDDADSIENRILDLGCGTGRTAIPLAARGYSVVGIDLSEPMLRVLVDKAAAAGVTDRIGVVRANLVQLDGLGDQVAGHAICMFSTLGMIRGRRNRQAMIGHVARVVRPGGRLVVHVHHRWSALRERRGARRLAGSWFRSLANGDHEFGDATYAYRGLEDMFMHRFGRRELTSDLRQGGWKVDQLLRVSIDGRALVGKHTIAGGFIVVATRSA